MSAHHDEQQEIETAKHLWRKGGKWLAVCLIAAAAGYFGHTVYRANQQNRNAEAFAQAAQAKGDAAKLASLQQSHPAAIATAEATMRAAALAFSDKKYDEAAAAYRWVLANQKAAPVQAAAAQSLAQVYLQQKKYAEALQALSTPLEAVYQPLIEETRGDIYTAQGKNKEAADAYKAALAKTPEDAPGREILEIKAAQ